MQPTLHPGMSVALDAHGLSCLALIPVPHTMPNVWIPPLMRSLSGNRDQLAVPGATLREVVANLEKECPGIRDRLFQDEKIKPGIAIAIDGVVHTKGLGAPVNEESEIHFVPAISGG